MGNLFHTILFQPIFNLLVFLYNVIPGSSIGFAIIALTIIIKLLLWPLMNSSLKSQKALQKLQPKIELLKVEHKENKEALSKALMQLYQTEKVNPFASCLPLLIQLPVLIALYQVLFKGFQGDSLNVLYPFVQKPEVIHTFFLGIDLALANIPLAVVAGAAQFWQTWMLMRKRPPQIAQNKTASKDEDMLASMNKTMMYFMPIMTVVIGMRLPGGLTLYWVVVTLFGIFQQWFMYRAWDKKSEVELIKT